MMKSIANLLIERSLVWLAVPEHEAAMARKRGAKFDEQTSSFYIEADHAERLPFARWFATVYAERYAIVDFEADCHACKKRSRALATLLPVGHQMLDESEYRNGEYEWHLMHDMQIVHCVEWLSPQALGHVRAISPAYTLMQDTKEISGDGLLWMNHCEHCRSPLHDEVLFDTTFGDFGSEDLLNEQLKIHRIEEPLLAHSNQGLSFDAFDEADLPQILRRFNARLGPQ